MDKGLETAEPQSQSSWFRSPQVRVTLEGWGCPASTALALGSAGSAEQQPSLQLGKGFGNSARELGETFLWYLT